MKTEHTTICLQLFEIGDVWLVSRCNSNFICKQMSHAILKSPVSLWKSIDGNYLCAIVCTNELFWWVKSSLRKICYFKLNSSDVTYSVVNWHQSYIFGLESREKKLIWKYVFNSELRWRQNFFGIPLKSQFESQHLNILK